MLETEHFVNEGYGWLCKHCLTAPHTDDKSEDPKPDERPASTDAGRARFFHEGEAEEREPRLSTRALARWRDDGPTRTLFCPECGAQEELN